MRTTSKFIDHLTFMLCSKLEIKCYVLCLTLMSYMSPYRSIHREDIKRIQVKISKQDWTLLYLMKNVLKSVFYGQDLALFSK
jgi:hypothetical protein